MFLNIADIGKRACLTGIGKTFAKRRPIGGQIAGIANADAGVRIPLRGKLRQRRNHAVHSHAQHQHAIALHPQVVQVADQIDVASLLNEQAAGIQCFAQSLGAFMRASLIDLRLIKPCAAVDQRIRLIHRKACSKCEKLLAAILALQIGACHAHRFAAAGVSACIGGIRCSQLAVVGSVLG